jgi:hypothetical protein
MVYRKYFGEHLFVGLMVAAIVNTWYDKFSYERACFEIY